MTTTEDPQDDPVKIASIKAWKHAPAGGPRSPSGGQEGVVLKRGSRKYVNVQTTYWGGDVDNPSGANLRIIQVPVPPSGEDWNFDNPDECITLEKVGIARLRAYLNEEFRPGGIGHSFWVQVGDQDTAEALQRLFDGDEAVGLDVEKITSAMSLNEDLLTAVLDGDQGRTLMRLKEHDRRSDVLDELQKLIDDPETLEKDFQDLLQDNPWVFGGEVARSHTLRNISTQDQIDIPIIRGDGSMVIVELKRAKAAQIKKTDHEYPVLSDGVHTAVQQAERYLYVLDKKVNELQMEQHFDARRATSLVVIGVWPDLKDLEKDRFEESFRIYNSHLARVQVITYDALLANARRLLSLGGEGAEPQDTPPF